MMDKKEVSKMQTVNISELKNHLSVYLETVKNGEEIIIQDRNRSIAKLVPLPENRYESEELELIADGVLSPPQISKLPVSFWNEELPEISLERVVKVITDERNKD